jgi:FkbM family methyltransferase
MMDLTRQPATREDIVAAYRLVLMREPDEIGLNHYLDHASQGKLAVGDVLHDFMNSPEYLSRNIGRLQAPLALRDVVDVEMDGYSVFVDRNELEFGRHIAAHRNWEPHLQAVLKENLREGWVFIDVGANVGVMTFAAAKLVGHSGKVIAFEPNEDNARMLLKGIAKNGFGGLVRLYPFGLTENQGLFALQGSSNTYLVAADSSERLVQSMRGDEVLKGEPRIDFVKLDIEGHEPFALAGLKAVLLTHRPTMLCEFNPYCLKTHIGKPPEVFAEELFELSGDITAVEYSGRRNSVKSPQQLIDLWNDRNREAVDAKFLPDGMLHFDLLFKVA